MSKTFLENQSPDYKELFDYEYDEDVYYGFSIYFSPNYPETQATFSFLCNKVTARRELVMELDFDTLDNRNSQINFLNTSCQHKTSEDLKKAVLQQFSDFLDCLPITSYNKPIILFKDKTLKPFITKNNNPE